MVEGRSSVPWKLASVIIAILVVTATFTQAFTDEDEETTDKEKASKIILDLSVKSEVNGDYGFKASAPTFKAYFPNQANDTHLLRVETDHGNLSYSVSDIKTGANLKINRSNVAASSNGHGISYDELMSKNVDVKFSMALNGIKETFVLHSKPNITDDLYIRTYIQYDDEDFSAWVGSKKVGIFPISTKDSIEIRNDDNETVFIIPPAFAYDSRNGDEVSQPSLDKYSIKTGSTGCKYSAMSVSSGIALSVVVPEKFLNHDSLLYPVYIDPTLQPVIGGTTSYSNSEVFVYSNVDILGSGTLSLDNCNLYFGNGPFTLKVFDNGLLELLDTDVLAENQGESYYIEVNGNLNMENTDVISPEEGITISSNDDVEIENSTISSSGENGIKIASTTGTVNINWTTISSSERAGVNISGVSDDVHLNGGTYSQGNAGIWITGSKVSADQVNVSSNDDYGIKVDPSTSWVDITNSTFISNDAGLNASNAYLNVSYSSFDGGNIGIEAEQSTVNIIGCDLKPVHKAIETSSSMVNIFDSNISDSYIGITSYNDDVNISTSTLKNLANVGSIDVPTDLSLLLLTITNCTQPLSLTNVMSGAISYLDARDNDAALDIDESTITISYSTFVNHSSSALVSSSSDVEVSDTTFEDNDEGANCKEPPNEISFKNSKFRKNRIGAYIEDGTFVFDDTEFDENTEWHISADNCDVELTSEDFQLWKYERVSTTTTYRKLVDIDLVNEDGTSKNQIFLTITDADGQIAHDGDGQPYMDKPNGASGEWEDLLLTFFIEDPTGSRDFKTPHSFKFSDDVPPTPKEYFGKIVADEYKYYSLTWNDTYCDFDDDGVPDEGSGIGPKHDEPRNDVTWFEAEFHLTANATVHGEIIAFNNESINGTNLLDPATFPEFESAYYRIYSRVRGSDDNASFNLTVQDSDGIEILGPMSFLVRSEYFSWFISDRFYLDANETLRIFINDTSPTNSSVFLDRIAVVKVADSGDNPTNWLPGHITDPLEPDSDDDLANDAVERHASSIWVEAEQESTSPRYEDVNASSGYSVGHYNHTTLILDLNYSDSTYCLGTQSKFQIYVKAREYTSSAATLNLSIDYQGQNYWVHHNLTPIYSWYASSEITIGQGQLTIRLRLHDLNDNDVNDGIPFILVDKIHIRDPDTDPEPTFYASDPMDYDTDSDRLSDGYETFGFFKVDMIEAEECVLGNGVVVDDGLVYLNCSAGDYFSLPFNPTEAGIYAFHVDYGISTPYGAQNLPLVGDLLLVNVTDITDQQNPLELGWLVSYNTSTCATELRSSGSALIDEELVTIKSFYYNMTAGSFDIRISINTSVTLQGGNEYSVWVDKIFLLRKTLDPMDSDPDGDEAWDGLEFDGNSFPLNVDTDDDTIWDGEEYFAGDDGWVTSPISNDTDADGINDNVEIDSELNLDPTDLDTDGDELPDGWIDGWLYHPEEGRYIINELLKDGYRQPWEGEDLDGDGNVAAGYFTFNATRVSTGGETDPTDSDSEGDGMPDGWELMYRGERDESGYPCMLDPLDDDAEDDEDDDGLLNSREHNFDTNPFLNDTDRDAIDDFNETKVGLRTNINEGMASSHHYSNADTSDWIVYNPNPYIESQADVYKYASNFTNYTIQDRLFNSGLEIGDPGLELSTTDYIINGAGYLANVTDYGGVWENESVYPIYGDSMLKFWGNDASDTADSAVSKFIYNFTTPISIGASTHISFWIYIKDSPRGRGHIGVDGILANDYLSDPTYDIIGSHGESLNVTGRNLTEDIWILLDYNLSAAQGESLYSLCVVYNDQNVSENGSFTAYFDNIRVYTETIPPYHQDHDSVLFLHAMDDGSTVVYNSTFDRIFVIANETESLDRNDDGILTGSVYIFGRFNETPDASIKRGRDPNVDFKRREALGGVDPFSKDSDGDGIWDGYDGAVNSSGRDWWNDIDGDGLICALDRDSDNDTISDSIEDLDRDGVFEPLENETIPYLSDTDGDGTPDDEDVLPLDLDNDGLTGFTLHDGYQFVTGSLEGIWGTTFNNPDTDGDGLLDGDEDVNRDGVFDQINETHPLDLDTDDDGLWDGYNNLSDWWGDFKQIEAENYSSSNRSYEISDNSASNNTKVEFYTDDYYEYIVDTVTGIPSGGEVRTGVYEIIAMIQDNCTEENSSDHNPKNISLYIKSTTLDETLVHVMPYYMFDAPNGNWALLYIGMVNLTTADNYTIRMENGKRNVTGDGERFYLDYINITRVKYVGEMRIGTDSTSIDTDNDKLQDGTEWGLINDLSSIMNDSVALEDGTDTTVFVPDSDPTTTTNPLDPDTDGDGLYDGWSDLNGNGTFDGDDAGEDLDIDGEMDATETDPLDADTDDDGLSDLEKVLFGTEPLDHDSDNDNLSDGTELGVTEPLPDTDTNANTSGFMHFQADMDPNATTDPMNWDTDNDTLPDGWRDYDQDGKFLASEGEDFNLNGRHNISGTVETYVNATNVECNESNPLTGDGDSDMLTDSEEATWGTDPNDPDTDNDSILDGWEVHIVGTHPNISDTDGDSLLDGEEYQYGSNPLFNDSDKDGLLDGDEVDWSTDSDGDGYINAMDSDSDDDGTPDVEEETYTIGTSKAKFVPSTSGAVSDASNMTNPDTDGDGINDTFDDHVLDFDNDGLSGFIDFPGNEAVHGTNYTRADTDYDGLTDYEEVYTYSTNATNNDTDGDSLLDGVEIRGWYLYFLNETGNVSHSRHVTSDPCDNDTDNDGVEDWGEYLRSDPTTNDTDGDHLLDPVDDDNSSVERIAPEIHDITLRVKIEKEDLGYGLYLRHYFLEVEVNTTDNAGVQQVRIIFKDAGKAVICRNLTEGGSIYFARFASSKDELADGFKVKVEITDVNGYTVFQVKEGDYETGWEKLWETLKSWVGAALSWVREVMVAYLTLLFGPTIAGAIQGFIEGFAKAMFDDLSFIAQIPGLLASIGDMVSGLGAMVSNLGMMVREMVNSTIQSVAKIAPYEGTVDVMMVWGVISKFFTGNWDIDATDLVLFCSAYVVMVIVGTIIWMVISGSVMAKIGKILKGTKVAQKAGQGMGRVQDVLGEAKRFVTKSDDAGRATKKASAVGRTKELGYSEGTAKIATKHVDETVDDIPLGFDDFFKKNDEIVDIADGNAKLASIIGDKALDNLKLTHRDEVARMFARSKLAIKKADIEKLAKNLDDVADGWLKNADEMLEATGKSFDEFGDDINFFVQRGIDPNGPVEELTGNFRGLNKAKDAYSREQIFMSAKGHCDELSAGRRYHEKLDDIADLKLCGNKKIWDIEYTKNGKKYQIEVKNNEKLIDPEYAPMNNKINNWKKNPEIGDELYIQIEHGSVSSNTITYWRNKGFTVLKPGEVPY